MGVVMVMPRWMKLQLFGSAGMQELGWVFGFSSNIAFGVVDMHKSTCSKSVFRAAGHDFIIYDGNTHTQIQYLAAALDKSCILTCDAGHDALLVQWDAKTGTGSSIQAFISICRNANPN